MPYSDLPPEAFWRTCLQSPNFAAETLYRPKWPLEPGMAIATAGSCFAQNIGAYVKASELKFVDTEPAPYLMPPDVARQFGYDLFSARYGNVYTARQLRQLLDDAQTPRLHECAVWQGANGAVFDALRPNIEPEGFETVAHLTASRFDHLHRVHAAVSNADVFVFTLGLTECWAHRASGVIFPTAPGVLAGEYNADIHMFMNLSFAEILDDLVTAIASLRAIRPNLKVLLTVSPVPLTATASGQHVLQATTYSKSLLRVVAAEICANDPDTDYMPSYEIITGAPFAGRFYEGNLRNVSREGVELVMHSFFAAHPALKPIDTPSAPAKPTADEENEIPDMSLICEEALLEAFSSS